MADAWFAWTIKGTVLCLAGVLLWILGDLFDQGWSHLSLNFLLAAPEHAGRSGGIGPILISTLLMIAVALLAAVPLGLAVAVWLAEFSRRGDALGYGVRLCLDVMAGVPSIVFGLFGNAFFCVFLGLGFSILSGGLTLACMILPVLIRTSEVGVSSVNDAWRQGAQALGMSRTSAIWHILLPAAAPAISAGLVLSASDAPRPKQQR